MPRQGTGSHKVLKEKEEEEERREMQAGLVGLLECDSPGGLRWVALWCLGGEEDQKTGGVRWKQGQGDFSLPAQRGGICRGRERKTSTERPKTSRTTSNLEDAPRSLSCSKDPLR